MPNRDQKGDRLPALSSTDVATPASTGNMNVVRKNVASPELAKGANGSSARQEMFEIGEAKPISAPLAGCEPVVSPFVDPAPGKTIGRCAA
jgi:hypothetical protein